MLNVDSAVMLRQRQAEADPDVVLVLDRIGDSIITLDGAVPSAELDTRLQQPLLAGRLDVAPAGPLTALADACRRAFDIAVSAIALLILAPIWLLIIMLIPITSPGPALYSQQRVGRNGRSFQCWKFRSMRVDADEALAEHLAGNPEAARQWAENRKLDDDPRVTSVGRILRRFDLDELPQLINILRGDMSLVGPRPVTFDELPKFGPHSNTVLSVKPGVTGLWQVSGRNSMTYAERVQAEVLYVRSRSLRGDIRICLMTPMVLVKSNLGR